MGVCSHSPAAPPLSSAYAHGASSAPSAGPRARNVGVRAGSARTTMHVAGAPESSVGGYLLVNEGPLVVRDETRTLTNSRVDAFHVLLVVFCLLLVVTVVLLAAALRLLRRVAAAVAAAEGSVVQSTLSAGLDAEGDTLHMSIGVDDEEDAAVPTGFRDSCTQLEEDARLQQPLLYRIHGRDSIARRHRCDSCRRQQQPSRRTTSRGFHARRAPLGISSAAPTSDDASDGEIATPRSGSQSHWAGCSAVPTPGRRAAAHGPPVPERDIRRPAGADASVADVHEWYTTHAGPKSTWQNSGSPSPSGAARKSRAGAVATAPPSPAPAAANHGGIRLGVDVQVPVFTATTEQDVVVYNTTHDSRYRILQRIGTGAFSSVYLVQQKTSGRILALKYTLCQDDRQRQAALRECEVIHCLQGHPQVIQIVDMFMSYQFDCARESPTTAGYPAVLVPPPRRREQAAVDQSSQPLAGVQPRAPAAIASVVSSKTVSGAGAPQILRDRPSEVATRTALFPLAQPPGAVRSHQRCSAATATPSLGNRCTSPVALVSTTTSWAAAQLKGLGSAGMEAAGSAGLEDLVVTAALRAHACGQTKGSSTECRTAVQDRDDDGDFSCMGGAAESECKLNTMGAVRRQYRSPYIATVCGYGSGNSEENGGGRRRGYHCMHSLADGVTCRAYAADADCVSDRQAGDCTLSHHHVAAIGVEKFKVSPEPILCATHTEQVLTSAPRWQEHRRQPHYPRPLQHGVQPASQGRGSFHLRFGITAKTSTTPVAASCPAALGGGVYAPVPLHVAASAGCQGYGRATLQSAPQPLAAPLTAASAAPVAATEASSLTRSTSHTGAPHMCWHTTNTAIGAVIDNDSDAATTANVSAGCCTTAGMSTTATAMDYCLPSTARNTTLSPSSGASRERSTREGDDGIDDFDSSSASRKIEAQAKRAARETAEMAQPLRRAPSRNSDRGDGQGGQPGHPAGKETWRTDLQANAVADETRSDGSDSARFSATTSSDTQEPTQPMYLILVPPSDRRPPGNGTAVAPESRCIRSNSIASKRVSGGSHGTLPQLQYRTHAPGEASPIAPLPSSANPPCCAGDAPAAVRPVTVSSSAAPSPVGAVSNTEGSRLLPATASSPLRGHTFAPVSSSASSPSGAATVQSIVHTSATPPQEQQLLLQPTSSLSAPQQRPMPSMAVSYSPARPGVSSADVSGDATGALSAGDPIRFKDFAPSPTTTTARAAAFWTPGTALQANGYGTATDAEDGRAHQQPHIFRGNPAQSLFVAAAGSENAIMGASGQGLDRQPSSFVDPYMERARGGEPVPPPRTSYAPGGGVRYNSLIVPYVAAPQTGTNGRRAQPGSNSSFFTVIASGTGTSAFEARKAVGGHEWRFQAAGAERGSPDTCVSASGAHALRLASPPPLLDASSATEAVVRDTYAPLRYSNAMQSGGVSLTTSSMACASAVSSLPPQQSGLSPSSPAPPPVASPALKNTPLVVPKAIRGAWAGQQGEHMDRKDGKPHINLPLHSANIALTPTQAPPSLPAGSLAGPASAAHLPRPGAAHCTAALSMKPLWASDGVAPTAAGLAAAPVTGVAAPPLRAGDDADREQQHHYGNARPGGAAPSPVRYTNAENPHLCNVYNANVGLVDAASAAAVSALANAPPTTDTRPPPNVCAGAGGFNGNASSTTTQMTASSDFPCNARDTGYLCLVMEYHPMGDLCRYVMRAKHQLEMRHHRQQQFPSHTLARSGAMSMATAESVASPATTTTLTSERSSFQQVQAAAGNAAEWVGVGAGVDGVVPTSPLSCRQSEVKQGGTAAVSSLLAAAAAATWTAKVARSHRDLHLALSAGVGGSGSSSGRHAAGGPEAQTTADAAADLTSDNPLTEAQLLSIAYQLASVLDHMHRQSPPIIHRDLKPENILIKGEVLDYLDLSLPEVSTNIRSMPSSFVSPADTATAGALSQHNEGGGSSGRGNGDGNDGVVGKPSAPTPSPTSMALEADTSAALWSLSSLPLPPIRITRAVVPIVLIDFGLSIQLDTRSRSYGSRGGGTRPYIAPESWQGGTCTASDVWSLGCVLYALATCRLTAKGVRIMSQEAKQDGFASRMLNDIIAKKYSLAFASFVVSLLVVDPAKRPTAAQAAQCFCVADGEVRFDLRSPFFSNVLDL
ncbi:hypothetical protein LSCM1_07193 [Leishmania martiniquensis]|uniref:Protein kinase domain-containing protein n=1 Tax=Leishmania martiniquensis TaxID=1580590 RepID=A0A836KSZ0_9TRYP|nr:hypothetical protein LSCM1_07193 [Leishmania martiniquensis]